MGETDALFARAREAGDDPGLWISARDAAHALEGVLADAPDASTGSRARTLVRNITQAAAGAENDQKLLARLLEIRSSQADDADGSITDAAYAESFRAVDLDLDALDVGEAAARLRRRPAAMVVELAAYLDSWSNVRRKAKRAPEQWRKPLEVARAADANDYRNRVRALVTSGDLKVEAAQLTALASEPTANDLTAPSAVALAGALEGAGERHTAVRLLGKAAVRHPADVWVNLALAGALARQPTASRAEALQYYTAARALRPETAHDLAHLLEEMGRSEEAEALFRDLVLRRPNARNLGCFGECLMSHGHGPEAREVLTWAVATARETISSNPDDLESHLSLGLALQAQGRPAEAETEYRTALRLEPDNALFHNNLGSSRAEQGKFAEAEAQYRAALKLKPNWAEAHYNLGSLLGRQGKLADAEAECLTALKLKPDYAEAHCNLGRVLRNAGRYAEALEEYRRGHELGSRRTRWGYPSAQWVRECERLVALDARLPAILKGADHPADAAEGLILPQICHDRKLQAAAARLYAEPLRADPKLASDRQARHPYNAACAAALAGCGQGKDDAPPDEASKAGRRKQAVDWLKAELAAWSSVLESGPAQARPAVAPTLQHWKAHPDLAGLREHAALATLPEDEQKTCRALWAEVDGLLERAQGRSSK